MSPPPLSGPSVLALVPDKSGPSLWRVLQPVTALQKRGYGAAWDYKGARGIGDVAPFFDGISLSRLSWPARQRHLAERWFGAVHAVGKFIVYDADDDLFTSQLTRRAFELGWTDGKSYAELESERFERIWAMTQCDGVTVSTQRLATLVRSYTNRPVVVVPNAIDVDWFRSIVRTTKRQTPGLTIGWAGGRRPDADVEPMAVAWANIAERYAEVTFVVQGHVPTAVTERLPPERLVVLPWMPLETYPSGLVEVDIACCAVADNPFNRCKSPIKAYEAALAGAVVVATPTVYGSTIEHGQNGYVAETAEDWVTALSELVESPRRRRIMALRLLRDVERTCSLTENVWRWPDAWETIAEDMRSRRGKLILA
jgi:glycosyltransferase involved in cell wall biosynthesis